MRVLRAVILGVVAGAVVAYVAAATVGLALTAAGVELDAGLGGLRLLTVELSPRGSETTFGLGLVLLPLACGLVNGAVAMLLAARAS